MSLLRNLALTMLSQMLPTKSAVVIIRHYSIAFKRKYAK